jgi:putative ABC transport system permease protein
MLGASPAKVAALLLCEALWLGVLACIVGLMLGQVFTLALAWLLQLDNSLLVGGVVWPAQLWVVPCLALGVSLVSALLPTLAAYRVGVLELLQSR